MFSHVWYFLQRQSSSSRMRWLLGLIVCVFVYAIMMNDVKSNNGSPTGITKPSSVSSLLRKDISNTTITISVQIQSTNATNQSLKREFDSAPREKEFKTPLPAVFRSPSTLMQYYSRHSITNKNAVVSIITPVFRFNETMIAFTAQCIKHQSLQNWEWIIVDDALEENQNLKKFVEALQDKRVRIVRNGHLGLCGANNFGVSQSTSMFVYPLHDDDLIGHLTLELLYFSLQANPLASFANGYCYGFDYKNYEWRQTYAIPKIFLKENLGTYSMLIRKDHWNVVGGYDRSMKGGMEDWDFTLKLLNAGKWGYTVPEFTFWYRTRENHGDRWTDYNSQGLKTFVANITIKYPNLNTNSFPILPCPNYSKHQNIEVGTRQANGIILESLPKKKKRLLMIVPRLVVGGPDKFNHDLVKGLVAAGWEITIVCTLNAEHTWLDNFSNLTSDIFILSDFLPYSHYPLFLRHLLLSRTPDVVLTANSDLGHSLIRFLTLSYPRAVFVDYIHSEHFFSLHGGYPRELTSWYNVVFVASSHLKNWMIDGGAKKEKVQVLYAGVYTDEYARDLKARTDLRAHLKLSEETQLVTLAASQSLDANKQPTILCNVASEIISKNRTKVSTHFLVVGNGLELKSLEKCILDNNLIDYFTITKFKSMDEMKAVMSASDVLFLSSQVEGIPSVLYEAMAAGVPVIAPDVGGIAELVGNNVSGYLLKVRKGAEFSYTLIDVAQQTQIYTSALVGLLNNPNEAKTLGGAGIKRVKMKFSMQIILRSFIETMKGEMKKKSTKKNPENCGKSCEVELVKLASAGLITGALHMDTSAAKYCTN